MAKKQDPLKPRQATLQMAHVEVAKRLKMQIKKGNNLLHQNIEDETELEDAYHAMYIWTDYNEELLERIVDTDELVNSYHLSGIDDDVFGPISVRVRKFHSLIDYYVLALQSILNRLDLIPEAPEKVNHQEQTGHALETSNRVFIVHGHDKAAKESVARLLEKLILVPIILHEQPNQGRTVIEKFEDYSDVGFAVVLLTPDDVGAAKSEVENLKPRARQNVIFELGFFIGKLGRARVCALHKSNVEILSDFSGVVWIPLDEAGAWRLKLSRELKAAGLNIDLNNLHEKDETGV